MSVGDPEWAERTPPPPSQKKRKGERERERERGGEGIPNPYILLRFRK